MRVKIEKKKKKKQNMKKRETVKKEIGDSQILCMLKGMIMAYAITCIIFITYGILLTYTDVTEEKIKIVQDSDAILREEVAKAGLERDIWQYFTALTNMRSVGVMGDERTYDYAVAIRAVTSIDGMTADWARVPFDVLARVSDRIVNEVDHVNRVLFDITSKPPGTIEFE